jgi:hypothetical protein
MEQLSFAVGTMRRLIETEISLGFAETEEAAVAG